MPELTDEEVATLQHRATAGETATAELAEVRSQLETVQAGSATAHTALLDSTRAANPTIPAELIAGDNAEQIAASVAAGAAIVEKVQDANKPPDRPTAPATNAGAPPRPDAGAAPEGTTGLARIQHSLDRKSDA